MHARILISALVGGIYPKPGLELKECFLLCLSLSDLKENIHVIEYSKVIRLISLLFFPPLLVLHRWFEPIVLRLVYRPSFRSYSCTTFVFDFIISKLLA